MILNSHSYHSLRFGTIPLRELVQQAVSLGHTSIALTDINTVTGIYDFVRACLESSVKPLVGLDFRTGARQHFIGIARNQKGLAEMNAFLTEINLRGIPLPDRAPRFSEVLVIYPLAGFEGELGDREFIGIRSDQLNLLYQEKWKRFLPRMVILHHVTISGEEDYKLHQVLRAIDNNTLLSKLSPVDCCRVGDQMPNADRLLWQFADYPQIIENTRKFVGDCDFSFDFGTPRNKRYFTGDRKTDLELLSRLAFEGMQRRYGSNAEAERRIKKELKVIDELGFSGYFLITWDIVRYSDSLGLMHVGRGSGANSIVSYCIGITDVCPIELDLYFERFLNVNRKSPPDFDIDWSWRDRDTILRYIFDKYGADHVAFCGTNVEFKYRSIFREVGKAFGLAKEELDQLAKNPMSAHDDNEVVREVQHYGMMLERYPNQRSMHACGILISEEPITNFTALELPPKGFPIVQFDMHTAEDIGFEKFDILSQRGLGTIREAVELVRRNRGVDVDIRNTVPLKRDSQCNNYLAQGRTIGCFYIESPAMRGLLRRLECDNYRTLVAASSIIRPGVAQSGMMREYVWRHNNPGKFEYLHEVLEQQLGETYGIMVYQEDVIKIAIHYGGLEPADGDILRRAMSGKGRSLSALQKVRDNFFASCLRLGRPEKLSAEIYRQIESFAGYSFCKAHSASYAEESYQSLFLKVYYPVEFMVAAINNGGGFYRTEIYVHEARMSGGRINNPCVNRSQVATVLFGNEIYLGFSLLQGLPSEIADLIVVERERAGNYASLEDFIRRVPIGIETIQTLIFIGAFRFTGKEKNELLVGARMMLVNFRPEHRMATLFEQPAKEYLLPQLRRSLFEDAFDEIELIGFTVSCTPFDLLETSFRGNVMARELNAFHKKQVRMLAYLVSRKHVPTKRGDMYFGTWIDHEGTFFDTAHFPDSLKVYNFAGGGCYLLYGTVEVDFHFPTITIHKMAKMPMIADPRYAYDDEKRFDVQSRVKEDVSMTHRAPYPQEHEIGLPRNKIQGTP
ncbi:DNA polymerase III subunit alpha [Fluviicola sp.]|uniref:DNA polymerase III subunit alpha n=1 Tax=Fluviicola sp. TaxID=1917219 RepID=UPI0031D96FA1